MSTRPSVPAPPPPDAAAFAEIYARDRRYVWRSVRRLGVPARDLPDVTHEVFITVFRNLWKFDGRAPFRSWLYGVLMRVVSDHLRLARHRHEFLEAPPDVADRAPRPDEQAQAQQEWRRVDRALATLDVRHRAVLVMHDFEGHGGPEIARALGIHGKTVYSRLITARRRFLSAATDVAEDAPSRAPRRKRLVMATVVGLSLSALKGTAPAEPCPALTIEGPPALTVPIVRGLEGNGLAVGGAVGCAGPRVHARVSASTRGFQLHVEDRFGRTSDRVVSDPGTAVSLIESWAGQEDADLLTSVPREGEARAATTVTVTDAATTTRPRLYGGVTTVVGSDGTVWSGVVAGGCARLGWSCLGAELSGARDLGLAGGTTDPATTRTAAELVLTAAVPFATDRWLFMPSVGLGAGWMRTQVASEDPDGATQTADSFGVRGALSLLGGVSLSEHVMMALELTGALAPDARAETSTLPAEPRFAGRAALACVVTP